jgi:hypothetical protein
MDGDSLASGAQPDSDVYQRVEEFEQEDFAGELLVVQPHTQCSLMLNPAAAALWEALQWPQTVRELVDLMLEANPQHAPEAATRQVEEALTHLCDAGLVSCTSPGAR